MSEGAQDKTVWCSELPIVAERERQCTEPFHWDDGVPYCNTCGLFRATIAIQWRSERRR